MQLGAARGQRPQLEQEAIELRLGERVGPLHLDRVLRGEHEERRRQRVGLFADGDRLLLHRLQQRRLRLGRRAVDLVGQHDVGEDRPLLELEPPPAGVVDDQVGPDDVGGHEIGRELHARKGQIHGRRGGPHQQRLAEAGDAFDEHVAAGQQRRGHGADDVGLADQPATDLGQQPIEVGPERRDGGGDGVGAEVDLVRARGAHRALLGARAGGRGRIRIEVAAHQIALSFGDRGRAERVFDRGRVVVERARIAGAGKAAPGGGADHLGASGPGAVGGPERRRRSRFHAWPSASPRRAPSGAPPGWCPIPLPLPALVLGRAATLRGHRGRCGGGLGAVPAFARVVTSTVGATTVGLVAGARSRSFAIPLGSFGAGAHVIARAARRRSLAVRCAPKAAHGLRVAVAELAAADAGAELLGGALETLQRISRGPLPARAAPDRAPAPRRAADSPDRRRGRPMRRRRARAGAVPGGALRDRRRRARSSRARSPRSNRRVKDGAAGPSRRPRRRSRLPRPPRQPDSPPPTRARAPSRPGEPPRWRPARRDARSSSAAPAPVCASAFPAARVSAFASSARAAASAA